MCVAGCGCILCTIISSASRLLQETSWRPKTKRECSTPTTFPCGTKEQQNKFLVPSSTRCPSTQVCCKSEEKKDEVIFFFQWKCPRKECYIMLFTGNEAERLVKPVMSNSEKHIFLNAKIKLYPGFVLERSFSVGFHPSPLFLFHPYLVVFARCASLPPLPLLLIPGCVLVDRPDCCGLK